jgi:hypothetical protein
MGSVSSKILYSPDSSDDYSNIDRVAEYQGGGTGWTGPSTCGAGYICTSYKYVILTSMPRPTSGSGAHDGK